MAVKLGINPLTWSNDDLPTLGGETPLSVCLREGRQAGFTGFELGNKFSRDPDVLGPILAEHDLSLASGWFSGGLLTRGLAEEKVAIQSHVHLLKSLGCEALIYCDITGTVQGEQRTPLSHRPRLTEAQWPRFCEQLSELARWVNQQGLRLAYHHHMGTVIESQAEVERLMANTDDAVELLLDTGHLYFAGGDPVAVAERFAHRVAHVHCKDMRAAIVADCLNRDTSFIDALLAGSFAVPGDGCIDYPRVLAALAQANYQGWLIVEAEQDPMVAPSFDQASRGYAFLERAAKEAALL